MKWTLWEVTGVCLFIAMVVQDCYMWSAQSKDYDACVEACKASHG